jgi:hypothetical protein
MSKNIRKNSNISSINPAEEISCGVDQGAPYGLDAPTANQISSGTVFDAIEGFTSVGQITALRSIANSAIIVAVYSAHTFLTEEDANKAEAARLRMVQNAELYNYTATSLLTLAQTPFDYPMTLEQALDFACKNAVSQANEELPDEMLDILGITREHLQLIDADAKRKAAKRDADLRQSMRDLREGLAGEVSSYLSASSDEVLNQLTPDQHQTLFTKVVGKLQARVGQLLGMRSRYSGAIGEAMLLANDVKVADKAYIAFMRANAAELRNAA